MPFTIDQFLGVFGAYNPAIWPAHLVAYALGLVAVASTVRPHRFTDALVMAILALFWIWNGLVYHIGHFALINPAAWLFGAAFVAQGLLFAWHGIRRFAFGFAVGTRPHQMVGLVLIGYAMVIYELLAAVLGHEWPRSPLFGVAPCPTTIFSFGMLLLATRPVPRQLLVVPFLWTLIGGSAAVLLDIPEDYGLIAAGILGTLLLVLRPVRRHGVLR